MPFFHHLMEDCVAHVAELEAFSRKKEGMATGTYFKVGPKILLLAGFAVDNIFSVHCCCLRETLDTHKQFWATLAVIWIYADRSQIQMFTQFTVYCQMTIKNSLAGTLATTNMIQTFGE